MKSEKVAGDQCMCPQNQKVQESRALMSRTGEERGLHSRRENLPFISLFTLSGCLPTLSTDSQLISSGDTLTVTNVMFSHRSGHLSTQSK